MDASRCSAPTSTSTRGEPATSTSAWRDTWATNAQSVSGAIEILNARGGPELMEQYLGPQQQRQRLAHRLRRAVRSQPRAAGVRPSSTPASARTSWSACSASGPRYRQRRPGLRRRLKIEGWRRGDVPVPVLAGRLRALRSRSPARRRLDAGLHHPRRRASCSTRAGGAATRSRCSTRTSCTAAMCTSRPGILRSSTRL